MTNALPIWVEYARALAIPAIALAGVLVAAANLWLGHRKRKDELFDRRYAFYRRFQDAWKSKGNGAERDEDPEVYWDDLEPFAMEAEFLFGDSVANFIRSMAGKSFQGYPGLDDGFVSEKFKPYLSLGAFK